MNDILMCTGHYIKYPDIIRAENCSLFDSKGNKYLDLESGVWCTSVGHSNPRIIDVISEQSRKIIHTGYCYINPIMEKTSEKVLQISGINTGQCIFLCSGSEAVEFSVKITQSISNKPYILTMKDSYLSAIGAAGEKDKENWILFDWNNPGTIDEIPFEQVSAFIFEPGSSSGLVNFPPTKLIHKIIENVRINNGVIIANEVTTGIGRTGEWFGYNYYNIIPDIVAIGKGLGNGYPVSCTVVSNDILQKMDFNNFHYAQSHQNDPLGASIANEVIKIIEDNDLLLRCKKNGEMLKNKLNAIKEKYNSC